MPDKAPDEQPKRKLAKRVITPKRLYFVPEHNVSVEATSTKDAVDKARRQAKSVVKDGDGK